MNIPNILTIIRITLTPLLVIFMIQGQYMNAFWVFTLAGVTDALDGLIARWLNQRSRIGAVLDPVADKLLLSTSYVVTAITHMIPPWLAVIVISRDVIIVIGVLILFLFKGGIEIRPSILGKLTTLIQLGTVFFTLLDSQFQMLRDNLVIFFGATALVTIASGLQYLARGIVLINTTE